MASVKASEGDLMGIAVFCLEQARQAIALVRDSPNEADVWRGLDDFDTAEFYVLKLDHVYEACCELNKNWPPAFKKPARNAANSFVQLWNGSTAQQRCEGCAKNERPDGPTRREQAECEWCQTAKHGVARALSRHVPHMPATDPARIFGTLLLTTKVFLQIRPTGYAAGPSPTQL